MQQPQFLCVLLVLLAAQRCLGNNQGYICVDDTNTDQRLVESLNDMRQLEVLQDGLNDRSIAPWSYVPKFFRGVNTHMVNEAHCQTHHSCGSQVVSEFSLETVPITMRMPVLSKTNRCNHLTLEMEEFRIACICATARQS